MASLVHGCDSDSNHPYAPRGHNCDELPRDVPHYGHGHGHNCDELPRHYGGRVGDLRPGPNRAVRGPPAANPNCDAPEAPNPNCVSPQQPFNEYGNNVLNLAVLDKENPNYDKIQALIDEGLTINYSAHDSFKCLILFGLVSRIILDIV